MASKASKTTKSTKSKSSKPKPRPTKRAGSSSNQGNPVDLSRTLLRGEVIGAVLVLAAIFTLLSLVTSSRGQVTDGWIGFLRSLFGVGVWGIPLVLGALGLWLVIRAVERMPNMAWQRPVGFLLLFLSFITATALAIPGSLRAQVSIGGEAGGQVGWFFADLFQGTVGSWGAWAIVTFLVVCGIILLLDRLLVDAWYALTDWYNQRQRPVGAEPTHAFVPPPATVPVATGILPWWKRMFQTPPHPDELLAPLPPSNLVRPEAGPAWTAPATPAAPPGASTTPLSKPTPTTPAPQRPLTQPATDSDLLNPRIVGGAQDWKVPPLSAVLNDWERVTDSDELIRQQGRLIQETLALFGVPADFEGAYKGPSVTQYLIKPGYIDRKVGPDSQRIKVKVAKIAALSNDLALALAAPSVRIEAPIPGTNYVGVEVPNQSSNVVGLKELMESETFVDMKGRLRIALGEDVKGQPIVADLARMPHLLIAGATGSGKSVCINSIIACLLLTHTPDSLRMLMVDPKMVELSVYNGIPHLYSPVVTEVDKAAQVLFWAVKEMERRYTLFNKANARDLVRYNAFLQKNGEKPLPYIVVVVDEMADLMMAAPEEVEKHICRLAQMARAVGIHLIIATQRPSVDVITGLIKANFPARIAFAVTSQTDSRVILDIPGAERLLGRGDMLFMAPDASKLERIQGTFLSDDEINKLVRYWKGARTYESSQLRVDENTVASAGGADPPPGGAPNRAEDAGSIGPRPIGAARPGSTQLSQAPLFEQVEQMKAADARDELFDQAVSIVQEHGRGSISLLQRHLRIGYGRAARLVDQLEAAGVLGPDQGASRGRDVIGANEPPVSSSPPSTIQPSASGPSAAAPSSAAQPPATPKPRIVGGDGEPDESPPRVWM